MEELARRRRARWGGTGKAARRCRHRPSSCCWTTEDRPGRPGRTPAAGDAGDSAPSLTLYVQASSKRGKKDWARGGSSGGNEGDLEAELAALALRVKDSTADGNCFFRSVSDQLEVTVGQGVGRWAVCISSCTRVRLHAHV